MISVAGVAAMACGEYSWPCRAVTIGSRIDRENLNIQELFLGLD